LFAKMDESDRGRPLARRFSNTKLDPPKTL